MIASFPPPASPPTPFEPDTAPPGTENAAAQPFTILVIEDDAAVRTLVRRTLLLEGYRVLEAADGELGLRVIQTHSGGLDLVLTDIDMPKIDGITVAEVLAALRPLLGVICMSGTVGHALFADRLGLRRQPFLAKPFTPDDLALMAADTLARSQELLAQGDARATVTCDAPIELEAGMDLVAAAYRLRTRHAKAARSEGPSVGCAKH
jgi:CheY-like chemotaxis protein